MPRPFREKKIHELREFFLKHPTAISELRQLREELNYRSTAAAEILRSEVDRSLHQQPTATSFQLDIEAMTSVPTSDQFRPLPANSPQALAAKPRIAELRHKLLDLSTRNRLLNFKHSARAGRFVRVIDEDPTDLFLQLQNDKTVELVAIPEPPDEPLDEANEEFRDALEEALLTDKTYLRAEAAIEEDGGDDAEAKLRAAQRDLRDRLRRKLGMRSRSEAQLGLSDYAKRLGINPDFDLSGRKNGGDIEHIPLISVGRRRPEKHWQSLLGEEDLSRRLRGIDQAAREARQEYGIDTLYFIFGFLEWSPPAVEGQSVEVLFSPLVLQPITIEKKNASRRPSPSGLLLIDDDSGESTNRRETYALSAADADECAANLTLRERLRQDYGLVLPELDKENPDLDRFFGQVAQMIRRFPNWRVRRFVTLTHLSFSRLPMWRDLDPEATGKMPPHCHPMLGELFGGRERSEGDEPRSTQEDHASGPIPLLRDCDSSQYAAIRDALRGRNLVIQGPPGTGKSQTISNLIGALLHDGKTVLFVAEKQVALEVVQKRLADAGLGAFLLELHSAKAGKKQLIESIRRRLSYEAPSFDAVEHGRVRQLHSEAQAALDRYADSINAPVGNSGFTLHDVIWRRFQIREEAIPRDFDHFSFRAIDGWSQDDWAERRSALVRLQALDENRKRLPDGAAWDWVNKVDLHVPEQRRVLHLADELSQCAGELAEVLNKSAIEPATQFSVSVAMQVGRELSELPDRPAATTSEVWNFAATPGAVPMARRICDALQRRDQAIRVLAAIAPKACDDSVNVRTKLDCFEHMLGTLSAPEELRSIVDLETRAVALDQATAEVTHAAEILRLVAEYLGRPGLTSRSTGVRTAAWFIEHASEVPSELAVHPFEFDREDLDESVRAACKNARLARDRIAAVRAKLAVDLDGLTVEELEESAKQLDEGWFGMWLFSAEYRKARRFLARVAPGIPAAEGAALFRHAVGVLKQVAALRCDIACKLTGGLFAGVESSLGRIEEICGWIRKVRGSTPVMDPDAVAVRAAVYRATSDGKAFAATLNSGGAVPELHEFGRRCERHKADPGELIPRLKEEGRAIKQMLSVANEWGWCGAIDAASREAIATNAAGLLRANEDLQTRKNEAALFSGNAKVTLEEVCRISSAVVQLQARNISESWKTRAGAAAGEEDWISLRQVGELLSAMEGRITTVVQELAENTGANVGYLEKWLDMMPQLLAEKLANLARQEDCLLLRCQTLALEQELERLDLSRFVPVYKATCRPTDSPVQTFDRVAIRNLAEVAFQAQPALREFRHKSPSEMASRFRDLDKRLQACDRAKLINTLIGRPVPEGNGIGPIARRTEGALLRHVCSLQSPRTPVRELIRRSGRALQALKPCFMMSPLSVAQLIERGELVFDAVVFDEASQVRPEDALCAMARAKQFVVVGDQMQLPPTSFGVKTVDSVDIEEEEEAEDQVGGVESILELAATIYGSGRMLLWHYRSRDPSLIAFSNEEFYDRNLHVFPAPSAESKTMGIHYVEVNGQYSARTNVIEAKVCANAAIEFMRRFPNRSLGIVALNRPQADLIELELDRLIDSSEEAQQYRAKWGGGLEALFVKNLESVQGDERDVIFISTVFGTDENGNFFQRFGPINGPHGHRRLNVLFTRAKEQVVVFSSLPLAKIQAGPESRWGVRSLKGYLEYAKSGRLPAVITRGKTESPFEDAVRSALRHAGFDCEPQVGVAGFFIDLAVRNPSFPDEFVVGVECDGASYHRTKSARDRDRLRQEILEELKWKIFRVWSTDWYSNPKGELEKLLQHIRAEIAAQRGRARDYPIDFNAIAARVSGRPVASGKQPAAATKTPQPTAAAKKSNAVIPPEYGQLVAAILSEVTEPRLRRLLSEAFEYHLPLREVTIEVELEGPLRHARMVETYNRHIWLWLEGNRATDLKHMPWPAGLPTADQVRLRAQAVKDVVARLR